MLCCVGSCWVLFCCVVLYCVVMCDVFCRYPGVISGVNRDNTFSVDYIDGDKETHVPKSLIRPLQQHNTHPIRTTTTEQSNNSVSNISILDTTTQLDEANGETQQLLYCIGDRVDARFRGNIKVCCVVLCWVFDMLRCVGLRCVVTYVVLDCDFCCVVLCCVMV